MPTSSRRPPLLLLLPSLLCAVGVLLPLGYLVMEAADTQWDQLRDLIWRRQTLRLLANTAGLTLAVLAATILLAL
ncbi:MAG: hypothetical protein R3336_05660, partial [Phycisphaeraceae bacterium]|nr:hypothetical protein [Phycisphaeraceae bacterium]